MPAVSQQQQKLFGLALAVKRGEVARSEASDEVLNIVDSMSEKDIEDFASTSHEGLPKKVEAVLRELVKDAIKDNVVGDIVKEHKDCGCGCNGTTVGGCNTSLTEGLFQNIMKGVKNGSGPFTLVVIKDNKVVKQVTVNTPQAVPASYTSLQKDYPNSRIRVEDATGKIVFGESIEEAKKGDFEMGDFVHFKSANKTGMVKKISGDKVTIMTMKGDFTGDIKDIKVLYQDNVNEGNFGEIDIMAREARNFNEFVKEFYKDFRDFPKDKDTLKWLKSLYDGRSKDESVNEVGQGDWHFKAIKQLWDKSSTFTKKKIAALITKNPNSIWDKIAKELGASDYDDVSYYTDMLHLESKDGLERVAQGLPQTEEEPINEWKAEEVLQQLGGRRFMAMTGAKNFVKNDPKKQITFKIGGGAKGGINYVRITLTSMDLYNIEFLKARGTDLKVVASEKGVYNDQLQQMFTKHTGMHTRL